MIETPRYDLTTFKVRFGLTLTGHSKGESVLRFAGDHAQRLGAARQLQLDYQSVMGYGIAKRGLGERLHPD